MSYYLLIYCRMIGLFITKLIRLYKTVVFNQLSSKSHKVFIYLGGRGGAE